MKLITKEVEKRLTKYTLYEQDGKGFDSEVLVKFFMAGRYTFFVTGAEKHEEHDDWYFFGYCVSPLGPDCDEWGSAMLSELKQYRGQFGLGIERDMHLPDGTTVREGLKRVGITV